MPDQWHLDSTIGRPDKWTNSHLLRRHVARTAWSSKHGYAECQISHVPVLNLLYDKWSTYQLRALSQGLNCHALLTESTTHACFITRFFEAIGHHKIDLLTEATTSFYTHYPSQQRKPSTTEACNALCHDFIKFILTRKEEASAMLERKVKQLEAELARQKDLSPERHKRNSTTPLSPTTTKKARQSPPASKAMEPTLLDRPLASNAPPDNNGRKVISWLDSIKKDMEPAYAKKLDTYIADVNKAWHRLSPEKRPSPADLAAKWGLPVEDAAAYSENLNLKLSATAAYIVAYHTA